MREVRRKSRHRHIITTKAVFTPFSERERERETEIAREKDLIAGSLEPEPDSPIAGDGTAANLIAIKVCVGRSRLSVSYPLRQDNEQET